MLQMLPRMIQPREVVVKPGSIVRLRFASASSIAVVCGSSSLRDSGALDTIQASLSTGDADVAVLDGIEGDPRRTTLIELASRLREHAPDLIVAAGGGGVIDAAKVARAMYEHPEIGFDTLERAHQVPDTGSRSRLWAVPTTIGSGTEASAAAVISTDDGVKAPHVSHEWVPDLAILDVKLTESLTTEQLTSGALDAFAHALESFCSPLANEMTKAFALTAGGMVRTNLDPEISGSGGPAAREALMYAAYLGGAAQSVTSTGAAHALAHALGSVAATRHGAAVAIFLPAVLEWNGAHSEPAGEFAELTGFADVTSMIDWINEARAGVGLAEGWKHLDTKVGDDMPGRLLELAEKDICLRTNPVRLSSDDLAELIERSA